MDRQEQGEAESARRTRGLIVPVLLVVTVMGVAVGLSSREADAPQSDLQAKVVAVVPTGITVLTDDGAVYLSGPYDGDLEDLVESVAAIQGVARTV